MNTFVDRYVPFFERLEPSKLASLGDVFSESARFVDPFNDVQGHDAIRAVFTDMYKRCERPRFSVLESVCDGELCYLRWTFSFGIAGKERSIEGASRVRFGPDGRATEHTDYWDPARQIYESIPILGRVLKLLRARLRATQDQSTKHQSDSSLATERQS
mgnify:FL=1